MWKAGRRAVTRSSTISPPRSTGGWRISCSSMGRRDRQASDTGRSRSSGLRACRHIFVLDAAFSDGELLVACDWADCRTCRSAASGSSTTGCGSGLRAHAPGPTARRRRLDGQYAAHLPIVLRYPHRMFAGRARGRSHYGGWIVQTPVVGARLDLRLRRRGRGHHLRPRASSSTSAARSYAFDPTPRAIAYVREHAAAEPRFTVPAGRPVVGGHRASGSSRPATRPMSRTRSVNLQRTDDVLRGQVRALPTLCASLGHDRIDLLKLDIEGAEHGVIAVDPRGRHPPDVLLPGDRPAGAAAGRSGGRSGGSGRRATRWSRWISWNLTFIRTDTSSRWPSGPMSAGRPPAAGSRSGSSPRRRAVHQAHTLRALYPFAHEIIVVEGAAPGAREHRDPDGHSRDGTLEVAAPVQGRRGSRTQGHGSSRPRTTATPTGSGPARRTSRAGPTRRRATGDWLWQVDIDEFYRADEMERVLAHARGRAASIDAMTFRQITFWGGLDYVVRRLVPAPRRGRLPPPVPLAARLRRTRRTGRRPCSTRPARPSDGSLARRRRDRRRRHPPVPLLAAAAEAGHREVRLLRQRRTGPGGPARSSGRTRPGCRSTARSASTTSTRTRAGSSATAGGTRTRSVRMVADAAAARRRSDRAAPDGRTSSACFDSPWYRVGRAVVRSARPMGPPRAAVRRGQAGPGALGHPDRHRGRRVSAGGRARRLAADASGSARGPMSGEIALSTRMIQVTKYAQGGGAERIASQLHRLARRGHASWMATRPGLRGRPDDPRDPRADRHARGAVEPSPPARAPPCSARSAAGDAGPRRSSARLRSCGEPPRGSSSTGSTAASCSTSRARPSSRTWPPSRSTSSMATTSTAATSTCASWRR